MILIKTLRQWKNLRLLKQQDKFSSLHISLGLLCLLAIIIWFFAEKVSVFFTAEKRIDLILVIGLLWLLKYLIQENDSANNLHQLEKALEKRFAGAMQFLQTTTSPVTINKLPWYLLIGPPYAGKTTLLANSGVNFILQKQCKDVHKIAASENCDWWVTSTACIIDIPGKYLSMHDGIHPPAQSRRAYGSLWQFFLRLLKTNRSQKCIQGLILALPASQFMKAKDNKYFSALLKDLLQRIGETRSYFKGSIPCQLLLTKCDLMPGFKEFFGESSREELAQTFGITLPLSKHNKAMELFNIRFNLLIKKINQQLLWRMHQERNPMLRPGIKDFPLQLERIKEFILQFMKSVAAAELDIHFQGLHLTSGLQPRPETSRKTVIDSNTATKTIALFDDPTELHQEAWFIKQFLTQHLAVSSTQERKVARNHKRKFVYAAAIGVVLAAAGMLAYNFQQGLEDVYAMKQNIEDYQVRIATTIDPAERLNNTISLLNLLHAQEEAPSTFKLSNIFSFYTQQFRQKNHQAYELTLRTTFLAELRNYLEEYLTLPINKNLENIYNILKVYLMLGDNNYFNPAFIHKSVLAIMPQKFEKSQLSSFAIYLDEALHLPFDKKTLDTQIIQNTRRYLQAQPPLKLSYLILKNMDHHDAAKQFALDKTTRPLFFKTLPLEKIPTIYTAASFPAIMSDESILATQEALLGNWVLGRDSANNLDPLMMATLIDQLRLTYIKDYIQTWENMLSQISLGKIDTLEQLDNLLLQFSREHSPLATFLQTIYTNTSFAPLLESSPKLQKLDVFIADKNNLHEIQNCLQSLHVYLQNIINTENQRKAAFEAVSSRMLNRGTPDAITQLRLLAERSPEPLKGWLMRIANDSWYFLMKESGRYLDTSWQKNVYHYYQVAIAEHYPFKDHSSDLKLADFIHFFGHDGIVMNFYRNYLEPFIDTSTTDWHWKRLDATSLPFSAESLRQIREALRIHDAFFPTTSNKPFIRFALQPFEFGKAIRSVKLGINGAEFLDDNPPEKNSHGVFWPDSQGSENSTFIQLTLDNQEKIMRKFSGPWGWFKLIHPSFESVISKKNLLINLSFNDQAVKYILKTEGKTNPLLSFNLPRFQLPEQLLNDQIND